jgi:hypothetical protein
LKKLSTALMTKVAGTAFSTAIGGRFYNSRAPEDVTYPYAVFYVISFRKDRNFTDTFKDMLVQVSLFSSQKSTSEIEDLYDTLDTLFDLQPLTVADHTTLWMREENATGPMSEEHTTKSGTEEVWHYAVDYSVYLEVMP